MSNGSKENTNVLPFQPVPSVAPVDFADTTFQSFSERISDNYTHVLKAAVIPDLPYLDGLKLREVRVLSTLHFFDKPLTPAQISELLSYDPATVTRAVHKLVGNGKLTRADNLRDTRSVLIELTDEGKALAKAFHDRVLKVFAHLEDQLLIKITDEEKVVFLNVMHKISKRSQDMKTLCSRMSWSFDDE